MSEDFGGLAWDMAKVTSESHFQHFGGLEPDMRKSISECISLAFS